MSDTLQTISTQPAYPRMLYMLLKSRGADADAVFAQAGLHWATLSTDTNPINFATIYQLVNAAKVALQCPWLGLELGESAPVSVHGVIGHAAMTSRDLRQMLQTLGRFSHVQTEALEFTFFERPEGGTLEVREKIDLGPLRQFIGENYCAMLLTAMKAAIGPVLEPMTVDFPFPQPAWAAQYQRFGVGCLRFDAAHLAFHLPLAMLNMACLTADAEAYELANKVLEKTASALTTNALTAKVETNLRRHSGDKLLSLSELSTQLNVSSRTLIRKLKAEGTSYQVLLDAMRRDQATHALRQGDASVESIASDLGFQDASNFSRTFRRWLGVTPRQYRTQTRKTTE